MPTNVSPEYKKAEAQYRKTRDPAERLALLQEMLSTIPKHKGTEHLQADIKTRIKELTTELAGPRKGAARSGPVHVIRPDGSAQIVVVGPPNTGKSSLHGKLTGSQTEIGPYPYTTTAPVPGMFLYEDVQLQLVDLPPISVDFMEPWMPNAVQLAHAALLVVDLNVPGCVENVAEILTRLEEKRVSLTADWGGRLPAGLVPDEWPPAGEAADGGESNAGEAAADADATAVDTATAESAEGDGEEEEELADPFRTFLPTLLVIGKCDLGFDPEEVEVLTELVDMPFPAVAVSPETGEGIDRIGALLFHGLDIVRVYTKAPGRPPDHERPFTVLRGETVLDVARLVHRDVAASLKFAKVWGSAKFDGQQVGKDYVVADGDVVELHS